MVLARRALARSISSTPSRERWWRNVETLVTRSRSGAVAPARRDLLEETPRKSPSPRLPAARRMRTAIDAGIQAAIDHRAHRPATAIARGQSLAWCTRRCPPAAWNGTNPTAFISWGKRPTTRPCPKHALARISIRRGRPCSAPITATACGSAPRRRAAPASTMPLEPRPDAGAPWTVAATPPRPDATAPGTPPSRRRPDAIRRGAEEPGGRRTVLPLLCQVRSRLFGGLPGVGRELVRSVVVVEIGVLWVGRSCLRALGGR